MFLLRLIGQGSDLGERPKCEVLREEISCVVHITGAVGFEQPIDDLELGSGRIVNDVSHFGCVGLLLDK